MINLKWFHRLRPTSPAAYAARAWRFFVCANCAMIAVHTLLAQSPSEMNPQLSSVVQLPLSGRAAQTGSVSVTQSTTNTGGGNTVNVIDSSVSATPPFNGSVPQGQINPNEIQLTLEDALSLGLRFNLGAISQAQAVLQAKGQRLVARSGLLPNVNAAVYRGILVIVSEALRVCICCLCQRAYRNTAAVSAGQLPTLVQRGVADLVCRERHIAPSLRLLVGAHTNANSRCGIIQMLCNPE